MQQPINPLGGTMAADQGMGAPPPFGAPPQAAPAPFGAPPAPFGAPPAPAYGDPMGAPPPAAAYGSQPLDQMGGFGAPQAMVPAGAPMGFGGAAPMAGGGPKGQTRNPMMSLLISWVCFLYALYVTYQMTCELKAYLNTEEITPWWAFIFPLNLMLLLKLPGLVTEAKRRAGVANPEAGNLILYLFVTPYIMAKDLNDVWNPTGG